MDEWQPANAVEVALWDATDRHDLVEIMRILADAPLMLPGFADDPPGRQRLVTRDREGQRYLLVFTSDAAMRRACESDGHRMTLLTELAQAWPGIAVGGPCGLAVNPVTPIGLFIPPADMDTLTVELAAQVAATSTAPAADPATGFTPANEVERIMRQAMTEGDGSLLLDALVTAQAVVPRRGLVAGDVPTVAIFTSTGLCQRYLRSIGSDQPTVTLDVVTLLRRWPGPQYQLMVNPGSPIGFTLPAALVPGLVAHANDLMRGALGDPGGITLDPTAVSVVPLPSLPENIADLLRGG